MVFYFGLIRSISISTLSDWTDNADISEQLTIGSMAATTLDCSGSEASTDSEDADWLWLPAELVNRILLASLDLDSSGTETAIRTLAILCCTCKRLNDCAVPLWMELTLSMLPPSGAPFPSASPSLWRDAAARAIQMRSPAIQDDARLPRPTFGHSSVCWRGTIFLFGGRHDETHYETLEMLDLTARTWSSSEDMNTYFVTIAHLRQRPDAPPIRRPCFALDMQ